MKKILIALIIVLVGIQFIPVERTNPPVKNEIDAPADVKAILKKLVTIATPTKQIGCGILKLLRPLFLLSAMLMMEENI